MNEEEDHFRVRVVAEDRRLQHCWLLRLFVLVGGTQNCLAWKGLKGYLCWSVALEIVWLGRETSRRQAGRQPL